MVAYYEVPMFSCTELTATHMAVFYEFSNIIDIYIKNKPSCPSWNDGATALGIQNNAGTIAYVPEGRNTSDSPWETEFEAWRFSPAGAPTFEFEWVDSDGNIIGNTKTIEVCPDTNVSSYTARVTYTNTCNGDQVVREDDVTVRFGNEILVDLGENMVFCEEQFETILVATPDNLNELQSLSYKWYKDGILLPQTGSTLTVTEPGVYTSQVAENNIDCETVETIVIDNPNFTVSLEDDFEVCDSSGEELVPEITGIDQSEMSNVSYSWSTGATTKNLTVSQSGNYILDVTYRGCTQTAEVQVNFRQSPEVSLGEDFQKCINETVSITAMVSNLEANELSYTWYYNGGIINGETGSSADIVDAGTYTVEASEPGSLNCVGTASVEVSYYENSNCVITQGLSPDTTAGENDCLDLAFLNDRIGIQNLSIFNRYGRLIFEESNYVNTWCGQDKDGNSLPTGTYYYVIELGGEDPIFGTSKKGWIYVNREVN